jgi:putative ABC transport system substrate-binding protein
VRRREFITLLGAVTAGWALAARAQQPAMPVIGFLNSGSPENFTHLVAAFQAGLRETGYTENQNVSIEYRWAESHYERMPSLAVGLVRHQVAVIVATGGEMSAVAAKAATTRTPIVFASGGDPIREGLVTSLNRPGGNLTGIFFLTGAIESKRLGLLRDLLPDVQMIGALVNPNSPAAGVELTDISEAARAVSRRVVILRAGNEPEIEAAFTGIRERGIGALLVASDPFFGNRRDQIVALATRARVPAIYFAREFAATGGLMSYGANLADAYRQVGIYTGRILKGERPAELPILQVSKFEFVVNLKAANALGLASPPGLLAIADEIIE